LAYLQFNDTGSIIYDRVGNNHGYLNGNAVLSGSTAPVGLGTSSMKKIYNGGSYNFADENLRLVFPSGGTYPNGDLVVTRLSSAPPGGYPATIFDGSYYWIVNNYGNNTFTELSMMEFTGLNGVNASNAGSPSQFTLFKRPSNSDATTWGEYIDQADVAQIGGTISFNDAVGSFSQFSIGQDASLLPLSFLSLWLEKTEEQEVLIQWKTALEENVSHFIIERSRDGQRFEKIDRLNASNSIHGDHYEILDKEPLNAYNYYRIRAVDFSGEITYSSIQGIRIDNGSTYAIAFPNPIGTSGDIHLKANIAEEAIFDLYDINGRLLRRTLFYQTAFIQMPSLPAGTYSYRIHSKGNILKEGRLVKQ